MLILSNSLSDSADEGSLKLATSLVKRLRGADSGVCVATFERAFSQSDIQLNLNKFHISRELLTLIRKQGGSLLYIPFPAPPNARALRIWLLSLFAPNGCRVMMIQQCAMGPIAKALLRFSGAELLVFSRQARDFYRQITGNRVTYIKTGVDTDRFVPVPAARQIMLKRKYGFDPQRPLILHVGHMQEGRGIAALMNISREYQVLLVTSTLFRAQQCESLKERLFTCPNIRLMDQYLPNIEEIYQMCDAYFFPVKQEGKCIDVPLSCLEAAACGRPVITTRFGEMKAFEGKPGFYFVDEIEEKSLNDLIRRALGEDTDQVREAVLEYDWRRGVSLLAKEC